MSKINDVFVNNVLYNCSAGYTTHTSTAFSHDIVNNYFIAGPASGGESPLVPDRHQPEHLLLGQSLRQRTTTAC